MNEPEREEVICSKCNGSGEGQHEGTTCWVCKGRGCEWIEVEPDPVEDEESEE